MINEQKNRSTNLLKELKNVELKGHIIRTSAIKKEEFKPTRCEGVSGIEFFMDTRITQNQIRKIVNYIVEKYNFDAYYYTKSHSVKVWYRDAR